MQKMFEQLELQSTSVGLKVNANKSKVMLNKQAEGALFSICNKNLKQVKEYHYLGHVDSTAPITRDKSG